MRGLTLVRPSLKGRGVLVLCALLLLLLAVPAFAQSFPPLTGRVVDNAGLLSPEQSTALEARLAALEQQSGHQMVVATIPDLEGYEIEDYGYRLGRAWKIGDKKNNDGLLLIVAPNERKVRIEVGYGLEPIVTDALSSVIVQRRILPAFRNKDMAGGILAGADALIGLLQLPPDQAQARAQQIVAEEKPDEGGIPLALIFWVVVLGFIFVSNIANRFGAGRRYRGGGGPVVLWGPGWDGGSSGSSWGGGGGGGGFSGGGGSFGGGGSSGSW